MGGKTTRLTFFIRARSSGLILLSIAFMRAILAFFSSMDMPASLAFMAFIFSTFT
jgi:hypothetical protein